MAFRPFRWGFREGGSLRGTWMLDLMEVMYSLLEQQLMSC